MQKGYQIVRKVLERFNALPGKLSNLFDKSETWYRSHGYELRRDNPLANGNLSAVDQILRMADEYEAAKPGAGKMLAEELHCEMRARYGAECEAPSDRQIRRNLNKEFFEAVEELDKSDLKDKSEFELRKVDDEFAHIESAIIHARAHIRAEWRQKSVR